MTGVERSSVMNGTAMRHRIVELITDDACDVMGPT